MNGLGDSFDIFGNQTVDMLPSALGASLTFMTDAEGNVTHLRVTTVEGDVSAPRLPDTDSGRK
jgi:hypothetical protein